jgi:hypothetical protein
MLIDAFKPIKLLSGSHADTGKTGQGCFMNVIAYLNGEAQITDQSACVCVVVRPIAIWINDYLIDSERQILLPYIERAMGSATFDQAELWRRAGRAVKMAEEMQDIADADAAAAAYAGEAVTAAANAASAVRGSEAARASTHAAKASSYATKALTYAAKASEYADDDAYASARERIIDACLRFLDDCLPEVEALGRKTVRRPALVDAAVPVPFTLRYSGTSAKTHARRIPSPC